MDLPRRRRSHWRPWLLGAALLAILAVSTSEIAKLGLVLKSVDRASLHIDTVRRGPMVREVRGPGRLVTERILWVTALHAGRVEAIHVEPGTAVRGRTVLLELSNRDIELAALQSGMDLKEAEAGFESLKAKLESAELAQQALIAGVEAEHRDAKQTELDDENLFREKIIAEIILTRSRHRTKDLEKRLAIERDRLAHHVKSKSAQLSAQKARLAQLVAIREFRRQQLDALRIRAEADGVCQELPLEIGQWVAPGTLLAKIVDPTRLKAEIEIAEIQARDIRLGQRATIDTRHGRVTGRVSRIDPAVQDGTVTVDVALSGELPVGSRPDQSIDGTIELEKLDEILYIGRPVYGEEDGSVGLFRLAPDGMHADLVTVKLGKCSVTSIQIVGGLEPGDQVILSDMSQWEDEKRIRLN